jgi:hypothetical protein
MNDSNIETCNSICLNASLRQGLRFAEPVDSQLQYREVAISIDPSIVLRI